jgi:DNA uptake protein ComE-like DNA-binding protein
MRRFLKDYFSFSRSEKNALIIISVLLIVLILINIFIPYIVVNDQEITAKQLIDLKNLSETLNHNSPQSKFGKAEIHYNKSFNNDTSELKYSLNELNLFDFDPNKITASEMKMLGIPSKAANNIIKYREKGGYFYHKEDLSKIYGLDQKVYESLESYIRIDFQKNKIGVSKSTSQFREIKKIELNSAEESDLELLPSIGVSFAKRIVKYRQIIGGYCKKEQLLEVYGFDSVRYAKISGLLTLDDTRILKIPINLADVKQLGKHPYIGYKKAELIVERRNLKGPFKNLEDLENIIGKESYSKIIPYLKLWD